MAEITIWPRHTAAQIVFDKILKIAGIKAHLFKDTLSNFVVTMYRDGYIMGCTDSEGGVRLRKSSALTIRVGPVEVFLFEYGRKFLFVQAEKAKLPVAMIQKELEALISDMYADGYVFGKALDDASREKLKLFSDRELTVKLVMKEEIQNEACAVQAGNDISGAGRGIESGDPAGAAVRVAGGGNQPGDAQGVPSGGDGTACADDGASAHTTPV
jgi:hypothetical protein